MRLLCCSLPSIFPGKLVVKPLSSAAFHFGFPWFLRILSIPYSNSKRFLETGKYIFWGHVTSRHLLILVPLAALYRNLDEISLGGVVIRRFTTPSSVSHCHICPSCLLTTLKITFLLCGWNIYIYIDILVSVISDRRVNCAKWLCGSFFCGEP